MLAWQARGVRLHGAQLDQDVLERLGVAVDAGKLLAERGQHQHRINYPRQDGEHADRTPDGRSDDSKRVHRVPPDSRLVMSPNACSTSSLNV
jgi:hypothetical protein